MRQLFCTSCSSLLVNATVTNLLVSKDLVIFISIIDFRFFFNLVLIGSRGDTKTCKEFRCITDKFYTHLKIHVLLPFMVVRMIRHFLEDYD